MENLIRYLLVALAVYNFIVFIVYGVDKGKAKKGAWRIPERVLLLLAVLGGSIGALLGMIIFHHKTKKPKFYIGVPAILIIEVTIVIILKVRGVI